MTIRTFVMEFMNSRAIAIGELTERLGYRSKTSIARIINESANRRSIEEFAMRLRAIVKLTADEDVMLEDVLEGIRWKNDYFAAREMLDFLRGRSKCARISLNSGEGSNILATRYAKMRDIKVTLLNSYYVPVFAELKTLIRDKNACVSHYMLVDENTARTIHAVNAIMPVFYEKEYYSYMLPVDASKQEASHYGIANSDIMMIQYTAPGDEKLEDIIVFDSSSHGTISTGCVGTYSNALVFNRDAYVSIKRTYFECSALDDYVQYSRDYAALEYNRSVYKIKPDVSVDFIPADLSGAAVRSGPLAQDERFCEFLNDMLPELVEVYIRRVQNTYEKRRPAHNVMKRSAMWKFACNGRMSDHFWGMRAYTPQERANIFRLLLEQETRNPFFHIYFLKNDDFLRDIEIAYYEGLGMLILKSDTDYNLENGHSEILITHSEFLRLYKDYFLKSLIQNHVITGQETREFLMECIAYCEKLAAKESQNADDAAKRI